MQTLWDMCLENAKEIALARQPQLSDRLRWQAAAMLSDEGKPVYAVGFGPTPDAAITKMLLRMSGMLYPGRCPICGEVHDQDDGTCVDPDPTEAGFVGFDWLANVVDQISAEVTNLGDSVGVNVTALSTRSFTMVFVPKLMHPKGEGNEQSVL